MPQEKSKQPAVDAEDGARRAGRHRSRMHCEARDAPSDAGQHVQHEKIQVSEEPFDETAAGEQDVHVHREMNDADVHEHRGDDAPPFAVRCRRTVHRAPSHQRIRSGTHDRHTARHHQDEDGDVRCDERKRDN